jgi:hypothetical protein
MTFTPPRFVVFIGALAVLQAYGCGSVSSGADGGGGAGGTGSGGAGAAGQPGSAGHGGGGSNGGRDGGSAGAGADAGASCSDLASQYGDALAAARSCTVGATDQCQQSVSLSLSVCSSNCMTFVNDASALNDLRARWQSAGCANQRQVACPAIACVQPTKGTCVAADAGGGVCTAVNAGLPTN